MNKNSITKILFFAFLIIFLDISWGYSAEPKKGSLAVLITGLSGEKDLSDDFNRAASRMKEFLLRNGYVEDEIFRFSKLSGHEGDGWHKQQTATRKNLEGFFKAQAGRSSPYEKYFLFIAGHANGRDEEAMFHLPGPDVSYKDLIQWVGAVPAQHMMGVFAASQGQTWIEKLSKPGRILIAGNGLRSSDFIPLEFLRFFPKMIATPKIVEYGAADRRSLGDVFWESQVKVQTWYFENNLHPTELALLDANGDKKGSTLIRDHHVVTKEINGKSVQVLELTPDRQGGDALAAYQEALSF
jgi:hypothetical protein